ncbi:hypothetical protein GCM10007977_046700 [Dactylosporangium sucinum]|uniref:Uncharacterized protein n=1 Tax=Dactylosporangium sucinum TaxID=1424081 RepID=A0A917WY95_9ACTN|nr:hypothetical protein GCM10007977_046700 [Dactylosporangium sucinum]
MTVVSRQATLAGELPADFVDNRPVESNQPNGSHTWGAAQAQVVAARYALGPGWTRPVAVWLCTVFWLSPGWCHEEAAQAGGPRESMAAPLRPIRRAVAVSASP